MSYSQPLINQPKILFLSIGLGMLLGLFYAVLQGLFRFLGQGRLSYYSADIIFVIVFTLVSFFFMVLYNEGRVRLHLIIGEGVGFFSFYFSAGRYIYKALARLSTAAGILLKPYVIIFNSFSGGMRRLLSALSRKISSIGKIKTDKEEDDEKRFKNFNLFGKIHLKNQDKSV